MPTPIPRHRDNRNEVNNLLVIGQQVIFDYTHPNGDVERIYETDDCIVFNQLVSFHDFLDEIHVKRNNGRYPLSYCAHWSTDFPILPHIRDVDILPSNVEKVHWVSENNYMPIGRNSLSTILGWSPSSPVLEQIKIPEAVRSDLIFEAFNYFSETFPEEIAASEFTQGLFQLKALLPKIEDGVLNTIAGGYLNKSFGWDNLLADLGSFSSLVEKIKKRIEFLQKTAGTPTRLGFSRRHCNPLVPDMENLGVMSEPVLTGFTGSYAVLKSYTCVFHATAWITQTLAEIDGIMIWFRAIITSLGLDNPVKAVWQVLPFSFVVDWFADVSGHLDRLTRLHPAVGWDVNDFSHSFRHVFNWELSQVAQLGTAYERLLITKPLKVIYYQRDLGLPVDTGLLDLSNLSYSQAALLIALGIVA